MSSTTTAATLAVAAAADTVEKPPRRFPPPCWTQEETLALIDAYRERWYALRRGYLRTADWDAVAAIINSRFSDASIPKTSAQCRHKMEKLRQRYRAEKQRSLSYPYPAGRFISSWFFFDYMDAMENGTDPPSADTGSGDKTDNSALLKTFLDQSILKLKLKSKNNVDSRPEFCMDSGIKAKNSEYPSYLDMGDNKEEQDLEQDEDHTGFGTKFRSEKTVGGFSVPLKFKAKNSGKTFGESNTNFNISSGFLMKSSGNQDMIPPGLRIKKLGKPDRRMNPEFNNGDEEYWGFRGSVNPGKAMNGTKRVRNPVEEMVESIKLLGEGLVKMEKAKMEMAREMETARMEMELKRNEMILESQRQIVDAFVKGLFELKKNKKPKIATVPSDS
ncbi:Myb-like domain-containing protein [Abeliophyllum distichum]|uniref:Myb-like domain-containing protein n=1 Tax=Abeliophyllum distichum TaxID=126358 RepID=A0ABD1VAW8_9LAMI